jgi:hypothetical protein
MSEERQVPIPAVLIQCKDDLEECREVTAKEGSDLAQQLGIPFHETSAKLLSGVHEAFDTAIDLALAVKKRSTPAPTSGPTFPASNEPRNSKRCCSIM